MSAAELVGELFRAADPYPVYRELHARGPVVPLPGAVVVVGYDEASAVLRDPDFVVEDAGYWDSAAPGWRRHASMRTLGASLLYANGSRHTELRAPISRLFTPARLDGLRTLVEEAAARLVAALPAGRPVDVMGELASALPASVICAVLGVPEADREEVRRHAVTLATTFEPAWPALDLAVADTAAAWLSDYVVGLAERHPATLAGTLAREPDVVANLVVLLFTGFETVTNLLGSGMARLSGDPERLARLREHPGEIAGFVAEVLRHEAPVQLTSRRASTGTDVGGVPVAPGTVALVLLGAANRDARRYPDPDRFDPDRPAAPPPLTFGFGQHYCVGSRLAVLEAEAVLGRLVARFGSIRSGGTPVRHRRFNLRGHATLPLILR